MAAGSLQTPSPCVFHHIWSSAARLGYPYAVPEAENQSSLFTRASVCASAWMQQLLRSCRDLSSWLTKRSSRTAMATTNMLQQLWPGVPGVENGGAQMEGRGLRAGASRHPAAAPHGRQPAGTRREMASRASYNYRPYKTNQLRL